MQTKTNVCNRVNAHSTFAPTFCHRWLKRETKMYDEISRDRHIQMNERGIDRRQNVSLYRHTKQYSKPHGQLWFRYVKYEKFCLHFTFCSYYTSCVHTNTLALSVSMYYLLVLNSKQTRCD